MSKKPMKTEAGPPELSAPPEPVVLVCISGVEGLVQGGFTNKEPRPDAEQIEEGA